MQLVFEFECCIFELYIMYKSQKKNFFVASSKNGQKFDLGVEIFYLLKGNSYLLKTYNIGCHLRLIKNRTLNANLKNNYFQIQILCKLIQR